MNLHLGKTTLVYRRSKCRCREVEAAPLVGLWLPAISMLVAAAAFGGPLPDPSLGFANDAGTFSCGHGRYVSRYFVAQPHSWRTPITIPAIALLACALVASVAAPEFRANSIRFVGRLTAALLLFTLAANTMTSERLARQVIATLLGAAALVGAIAVLELAQVPFVLDALKLFRPGFHVVGGQLRATSTLFYPTITAMYLEVAFALGWWRRAAGVCGVGGPARIHVHAPAWSR